MADAIADPRIDGLDWAPDFDLAQATTMGVGGTAAALATARSAEALHAVLRRARQSEWPIWLLGGGSNTIFGLDRFEGVILRLGREFAGRQNEGDGRLRIGSAATAAAAVKEAQRAGLSGLEFMAGIPGWIGGALAGNAGQQGQAICDLAETVWGADWNGEAVELSRGEFDFSYRKSDLAKIVVTATRFLLKPSDESAIKSMIEKFLSIRREQPVGWRSSGCIFKNPPGESAGRLIDRAGLKGCAIGGAMVAREHANFIVNQGGASPRDVLELIDHVRQTVLSRHGVELELEVKVVRDSLGPKNA
ncbi:MAG: UDP-N-acetylenolpyruvoylglucosamine reductase [candidate division BRC1 bacterium ADurb.BinA364]|nr:MAG: UDP-N-acetylenolpyruvoylglucosamine reductase [candidate division BRC1 bacterium ADurb.BinA364]